MASPGEPKESTELRLGTYESAVESRLARFQEEGFGRRMWAKDPTLWSPDPVPDLVDRLGWLPLPETAPGTLADLERFTDAVRADGIEHAVVLGMGGSSLAPEVFARTFGHRSGWPEVAVLDSTHPDAVAALADRLDPLKCLFLVSSKSGGTTETMSYFYTFWDRVKRALAGKGTGGDPGRHFAAITDPGTSLEKLAKDRGFRALFPAPSDVGGRYSALTPFGLVPAALAGVDLAALLGRARGAAAASGPGVSATSAAGDPGLLLGAALGELARAGRDKLTFWTSPAIQSFPDWLEQLIAESTGKDGKGIVPVAGEPLGTIDAYGDDRFFVALEVAGEQASEADDTGLGTLLNALEGRGHPVARITLADPLDLGREMFRWEVAVAAAGAVLGIHPFNQPDVEFAKVLAKQAMQEASAAGAGDAKAAAAIAVSDSAALAAGLDDLLGGTGGYVGIHAYLAPGGLLSEALHALQGEVRDRTRLATTFGYGPRFLHSTGQLHKGGPAGSRFLQLIDHPHQDLPVPETDYTFAKLIRAQAAGDRKALEQRGRKVLTVDLLSDAAAGVAALRQALRA
jgi:transaldolase/glucose-6-phosphate isomerase